MILDGATSALDSTLEQYVQETIRLMRETGITVILISHRLSSGKNADKIIVLHEGKMVEEGKHCELLVLVEGMYRKLWGQQFELA